jgi:hypothetical protein
LELSAEMKRGGNAASQTLSVEPEALDRVVHIELDRVRHHAEAIDLFHL